jgi:hypothetical protein
LAVEGEIKNIRDAGARLPDLRVAVRTSDGREIYRWTAAAPKPSVAGRETVLFRARLTAPPTGA